jgi:hypothetical protein
MPPMTPEEFADKMREEFPVNGLGMAVYDKEGAHAQADDIMCDLLESLGYAEGVEIFRRAEKWYA